MPIPCHTFAQTCLFSDDRPFLPDGLTAFTFSILMVWRVHLRCLVPRTFLVVMYSGPLMLFARSGAFPLAGPSIPFRVRVFDISRPRAGHQFSNSNSNESVAICSCLRFTSSRSSFSHCIRTVGPGGGRFRLASTHRTGVIWDNRPGAICGISHCIICLQPPIAHHHVV